MSSSSRTKKSLITLPGPHFVVYESPLPTRQVLARLDAALHREKAVGIIHTVTQELKSQQELVGLVESVTRGGGDIMFMNATPMHALTSLRTNAPAPPLILHYQLGNPLYAQRILRLNPLAAANIPPRLVVAENEDGSGTRVAHNLWAAVMADPFAVGGGDEGERGGEGETGEKGERGEGEELMSLREELRVLDEKFEKLILGVLDGDDGN